jgi:hypothetical protein
MSAIGKAWCYLLNVWWDDADDYFDEADSAEW